MKKIFLLSTIALFIGYATLSAQSVSKIYVRECYNNDSLKILTIKYTKETGRFVISSYLYPQVADSIVIPYLDSSIVSVLLKSKLKANPSFSGSAKPVEVKPTDEPAESEEEELPGETSPTLPDSIARSNPGTVLPGPKTPAVQLNNPQPKTADCIDTLIGRFISDYKKALLLQGHQQELEATREELSTALSGMDNTHENAFSVTLKKGPCKSYPVYKNKKEYELHEEILQRNYAVAHGKGKKDALKKEEELKKLTEASHALELDSTRIKTRMRSDSAAIAKNKKTIAREKVSADSLRKVLKADSVSLAALIKQNPRGSKKIITLKEKITKDSIQLANLQKKASSYNQLTKTYSADSTRLKSLEKQLSASRKSIAPLNAGLAELNEALSKSVDSINILQNKLDAMYAQRTICRDRTPVQLSDTLQFQISTANLQFSHWVLGRIDVYGTIGNKPYHFRNMRIIPVASHFSIERAHEEYLVSDDFTYMIRVGDILNIKPNDSLALNIYLPDKQMITLTLNSNHESQTITKPSVNNYFNIAVFSDLNGYLGDNQPNGKLQTEVRAILPIWTRTIRTSKTKPLPERTLFRAKKKMYPPGYPPAFTPFKSVMPEFCVSKFGTENRFLPVQYTYQFTDSLHTDSVANKHVNHLNLLQYANLWVGGGLNVLSIEGQNSSSSIYINFRFRLMRTELADSLHPTGKTNNVIFASFEPEIIWRMRVHNNFSLEFGYSFNMLKLYNNEYNLSYGRIYGDLRDTTYVSTGGTFRKSNQVIYTPQFTLRYNPPGKPLNGAFFRMQFPNNLRTRNAYLILQIGIQRPISSFTSRTPKDEGSAKML
jgi:uncharacterized coiled-coil protein SlyX